MSIVRSLLTAFTLLSRIPVPVLFRPDYRWFLTAMPAVGVVAATVPVAVLAAGGLFELPGLVAKTIEHLDQFMP